jgi:Cdc6-like AAA superfamily ATPase
MLYGRDSEISAIIDLFAHGTPRVAILGAGGMGKTSLSTAIVHHPDITSKYQEHRVFVACDRVSTSVQLASLIGAHIGLKPTGDLTQGVIQYFSKSPPVLLILDNFETVWEPSNSRGEVEKFLALLTDVAHLALIVSSLIIYWIRE